MNKYVLFFLVLLTVSSLWYLRYLQVRKNVPEGRQVQIVRILDEEPKISGQSQYFQFGVVRVRARNYPKYHYGDRLKIVGKIERGVINFPQIEVLEKGQGGTILAKILQFRLFLASRINKTFGEPYSSLIIGMLLGIDQLPYSFKQILINTGTIHVVVVSGQNITIVAGLSMALAGLIKRRLAIYITAFVILFYTILAGAEAPVIRAAIMGMIAYMAQVLGRGYWPTFALFVTAVLMLIYDPTYLFSLSFQLSFAATLGVVLLVPQVLKLLKSWPKILSEPLAISTCAFILTLPIIAYSFGRVSLISIFSNLAVYELIFPLMALGFIVLVFLVFLPFLGKILAFLLFAPAFVFVYFVSAFSQIPSSVVNMPKFHILWVFAYYLVLGSVFLWLTKQKAEKV